MSEGDDYAAGVVTHEAALRMVRQMAKRGFELWGQRLGHYIAQRQSKEEQLEREVAATKERLETALYDVRVLEGSWSSDRAARDEMCRQRDKSRSENARLTQELAEAKKRLEKLAPCRCPNCGPGVRIDEDGCCATCGADADCWPAAKEATEVEGPAKQHPVGYCIKHGAFVCACWKWCPDCEGTEKHGDPKRCDNVWHTPEPATPEPIAQEPPITRGELQILDSHIRQLIELFKYDGRVNLVKDVALTGETLERYADRKGSK